jgi:hypothetical protein
MDIKYSNIFQYMGNTKFTHIGIFGFKINHLATLLRGQCYGQLVTIFGDFSQFEATKIKLFLEKQIINIPKVFALAQVRLKNRRSRVRIPARA